MINQDRILHTAGFFFELPGHPAHLSVKLTHLNKFIRLSPVNSFLKHQYVINLWITRSLKYWLIRENIFRNPVKPSFPDNINIRKIIEQRFHQW